MIRSIRQIVSVLACGASLAAGASCDDGAEAAGAGPATTRASVVDVRVVPVSRAPIPDVVEFIGTLFGDEEALIASKASGRIVETRVDLGDRVDDGDVLARVDPTDYQLAIQQREAALTQALATVGLDALPQASFDPAAVATVRRAAVQAENAQARLDRAKQLFEQAQPLISAQEFADTQTQYEVARRDYDVALLEVRSAIALARSRAADLDAARQYLADAEIRAPRSSATRTDATQPATRAATAGRWAVAERRTSVGEYVEAGTVVYKLIADRPIKLRASIPERYLNRVRVGQPVALYVESRVEGGEAPAAGTISRVSPAVDVASRTFAIEATFPNDDRRLKPGSFARGTVTVGERTDVSTVPAAALYSFAGLDKIFTVKDGKATAHLVTVISRTPDRAVVEGNLGNADQAVVGGFAKLATGVAVNAQPATRPMR